MTQPESEQPTGRGDAGVTLDDRISAEGGTSTSPDEAARQITEEVRAADPETITPPPRAAVVYNPTKVELDVLKAAIEAAATEAEWGETLWLETTAEDPGVAMAREAVGADVTMVLAAGGDGTVRAVAQGLLDTGVSLALLPLGTGNLLARNLELTLDDLGEAVTSAFTGQDRAVDAGVARMRRPDGSQDEHAFVVMCGLGLDAQMIEKTDEDLKKKVGWVAYVQAIVAAARGGNRIQMRIGIDDEGPKVRHMHTLLIGNCGNLPGNIVLLPEATLDDGRFDIVSLRPKGPWGWLQIWSKVLVENFVLHRTEVGKRLQGASRPIRALRYLTGSRVRISLREPEPVELDGDGFGEVVALETDVRPGALQVRVPADR